MCGLPTTSWIDMMRNACIAGILLVLVNTGSLLAQQPSATTAGMAIDVPEVVAEVKAAAGATVSAGDVLIVIE